VAGGTLMVSRSVDNQSFIKKRLEEKGFQKVTVTALEMDALDSLIRRMKPDIVMMGARFYECATPYQIGELRRKFPKIYLAVLCLGFYPEDLAMYCILNGAQAYVTAFYGVEHWSFGLEEIRQRRKHITPAIIHNISSRKVYPQGADRITKRRFEVMHFLCCGFNNMEIAEYLGISTRTVVNHKTDIHRSLNVRSTEELIRAALTNGFLTLEEIQFYPKRLVLHPKPEKISKGENDDNQN